MRIWPKSICGAGVLIVDGLTVAYIGVAEFVARRLA